MVWFAIGGAYLALYFLYIAVAAEFESLTSRLTESVESATRELEEIKESLRSLEGTASNLEYALDDWKEKWKDEHHIL